MNKDNSDESQNQIQQSLLNNLFANITNGIVRALTDAAFRGGILYFIWNLTLSQELSLPQLSYLFCACGALFVSILLSNPGESAIIFQLLEINKNLTTLTNLNRLKMTMDILAVDKTAKHSSESATDSDDLT